jgi:hypothetical protein
MPGPPYGESVSSVRTTPGKTLWEEGRQPGRLVRTVAVACLLVVSVVDVLVFERLSLLFDLTFVALCVSAALSVRPRDFFIVGVLPPIMMLGIVAMLAAVSRGSVAEPGDGLVQATVSGLAHHAGALVTGYASTLALLALRQVAIRNAGALRSRPGRPAAQVSQSAGAAAANPDPSISSPSAGETPRRTSRPVPRQRRTRSSSRLGA